jgi:soluble cytochrome b562
MQTKTMIARGLAPVLALTLLGAAACSSDSKKAADPGTSAASAAGVSTSSTTKEVENVSSVRPKIDVLTAALKAGDVKAAKDAYEAYDAVWNGNEVYVNVRSISMYLRLEAELQHDIEAGLDEAAPDFAKLATLSATLGTTYDKAIDIAKKGPALSPLFDDVATLRIIRADMRIVTAALNEGDTAKATTYFEKFDKNLQTATDLIKQRSAEGADQLETAFLALEKQFDGKATADVLKPLAATVTSRYNFGVSLWNAAARNAVTEATDLLRLDALHDMNVQLHKSFTAWQAGDFAKATSAVGVAKAQAFDRVSGPLHDKGADAALKKALEDYAGLAAAAGDAGKVKAANQAALDATAVAEQALFGTLWTDKNVQDHLAGLPPVTDLA